MKKNYLWACMLMAPAAVVSCSDINLSELNTDVSVQVRELTIPMQMDQVRLSTMLDIDDDSKVKVVNGEYAVVVEGDFESNAIHVDPIVIKATDIEASHDIMTKSRPGASRGTKVSAGSVRGAKVSAGSARGARATARRADVEEVEGQAVAAYALSQLKKFVSANADKVHEAIDKLTEVGVETHFDFDVNLADQRFFDKVYQVHLEDFCVKIPRGIVGEISLTTSSGKYEADYSSATGLLSFRGHDIVTNDGILHIKGDITGIDKNLVEDAFRAVTKSGARASRGSSDDKEFAFDEEIGVESGAIVVYDTDFKNRNQTLDEMYDSLDDKLAFSSQAAMEDIVVNTVSGSFSYDVDDVNLDDVRLNDVPDVLRESGTDIRLDNPQIYLFLDNNVIDGKGKSVGASAEMLITAFDDEGRTRSYSFKDGISIDGVENYLYLSPHPVADEQKYDGYAAAKHVKFETLGEVLSSVGGEEGGLPTKLAINTFNTCVSAEDVTDLALGVDYNLTGRYAFVAPLALSADSRIKYTDTIDGWAGDTEGIVVTRLALSANATTDVPFELLLRVVPINTRGERLGTATDLVLPANAKNAPIDIVIEGDIRDLDGVKIDATAVAKEARALAPDMNISLSGIKVKVSGQYETDF